MCVPRDEAERAAKLGALLQSLQAVDVYLVAAAELLGERAQWLIVCTLELWKAACRLRLLALQPRGRLLASTCETGTGPAGWVDALRRVGGASALRERAAAVGGGAATRAGSPLRGAATPVTAESAANGARDWSRLGDVIHVLQPIAYLGALQVCGPDRPSMRRCAPWPRAIPWLVAVASDAAALALCSRARQPSGNRASTCSPANSAELAHRRRLLLFLLLRPGALELTRRVLLNLAARAARGDAAPGFVISAIRDAAALLSRLDAAFPRLLLHGATNGAT